MRGLCNINVWRRKSGNSMEGFYFLHLSCISRIFRPECSFGREESMNLCIQISRFPPLRLPGRLEGRTDSAGYVKTMTIKPKHGYHLIQHEPAFPDDKFRAAAENLLPAVQR